MVLFHKTQCTVPSGLLMCHLLSYKCHIKVNHRKGKTKPLLCFLVARYLGLNSDLSTQKTKAQDGVAGQPGLHLLGLCLQKPNPRSIKQKTNKQHL